MAASPGVRSPRSPPEADEIGIDAALQRSVGEFGRGQQLFYCLAQLAWVPAALQTLVMVFTGLDPIVQGWYKCRKGPSHDQCMQVLTSEEADPSHLFCLLPKNAWVWTRMGDSIVSEWNLVCTDLWKQQAVNSGFFAGFLVGAGLFGSLSDRLGRKKALMISLLVAGISGVLCGVSASYWAFAFWRFVVGVGVAGVGMCAYVLGCEYVGPAWRGFLGVAAQYFFAFGAIVLPFLAFHVPNWRTLCILTGGSSLLYMVVLPTLPESPRWQLISGRKGDATATLASIASYNGTHLPDMPLADMAVSSGTGAGLGDVVTHSVLRSRLLIQLLAWFAVSSVYYGISLMVADLPGSVYSNNAILAVVEIPSYFVASILVERMGRRWTIAGSYLLGGICLILSACTSGSISLFLAFAAKCGAAAAFALIILFATELFPTVVRSACIGASSQAARVGGMVTPVIILAAHEMHAPLLAFFILGTLSTVAGLALLSQPETLGTVLPDTIKDVPERSQSAKGQGMECQLDPFDDTGRASYLNALCSRGSRFLRPGGDAIESVPLNPGNLQLGER